MNIKNILRRKYLQYRNCLSKKDISRISINIFYKVKKISLWNKKYYNIYLPIKKLKEINTFIIINFLMNKGKNVLIPVTNFNDFSMGNCCFNTKTILKENKYGILEPINKKNIPIYLIDVIFIPLIVFDLKGYRVGYGKGFYDRFIPLCNKNIIKIGLSYFPPIEKIEDIHKNDFSLDIGVTESNIFFFNYKQQKN
ncbi:5-formyltetrahydrofolate cyclo-ligase [Blattabacterium cuenoti]|uniref:5-formyltetrahydrofolate cyclo-ligase n=1 Tax=Blattabacterium cuenoti TaxID=1653831 RepID=UPI00163B866B|nr:5-formyltetrahydrofolate cyclo-ligase [Blattabacterium cuenoti]